MREDAIRLFGFLTAGERDWFRLLQSVQGVGAKVALGILGALSAEALSTAIAQQDKAMMARAPGVGPKLAARLVLELKDKAPAHGRRRFRPRGLRAATTRPSSPRPPRTRCSRSLASATPGPGRRRRRQDFRPARPGGRDRRAHPRGPEGTGAVSGRPFFVPMIGIVLLFAALGPAVGGALFIPLSIVFKTPTDLEAIGLVVLISTMFGHALGLIAAYIVGVGPAAATGFLYALWDAVAPGRAPRALVAALIGGLLVYGLLLRLNPIWASFEMTIRTNV